MCIDRVRTSRSWHTDRSRCAQSVHHDLKPNILLSSPLTQSIGTSFLEICWNLEHEHVKTGSSCIH